MGVLSQAKEDSRARGSSLTTYITQEDPHASFCLRLLSNYGGDTTDAEGLELSDFLQNLFWTM
jgi:hypothetical protein